MQLGFITTGQDDRRLGIIWNDGSGDSAKVAEGMAVTGDPGGQLLMGESFDIGLVAEAQHGDKDRGVLDGAVGLVNGHRHASPIDKHLLARFVWPSQHGLERVSPLPIQLAKPAVLKTLGICLAVFLPEQLKGHALAPQLLVNLRPRRNPLGQCDLVGHVPAQQLGVQSRIGQIVGQRPSQTGGLGALEVITHRADRQAATAGDFAHRQLVLMFESKDVFNVTHSCFLSCHGTSLLKGP